MTPNPALRILAFALVLSASTSPSWAELPDPATQPATWDGVDKLINEQKFEAAATLADKLLESAKTAKKQEEWTQALVKIVQLRMALHGYETSVEFLKEQPWPDDPFQSAILDLFYANALVQYYQSYSWEINQREKVETQGKLDLKAWTKDQIIEEATQSYVSVWQKRKDLGQKPLASLSQYLTPNNYPEGIRSTLRDAVTYLFVELLADTSLWRPEQSNEIFKLDFEKLLKGPVAGPEGIKLEDPSVHPLLKICHLLDDLESWHTTSQHMEAALEARLSRLERLRSSFTDVQERQKIKADLESRLGAFKTLPWWAMGQGLLAEMVREEDAPDSLIKAREIALAGQKAYPNSVGGQKCLSIVKSIEAPDYEAAAMSSDGVERRSVEIRHKNLAKVYFRAYAQDLARRVQSAKDYNLLPAYDELNKMVASAPPKASWAVNLPATPDYRMHRTFVTPSLEPGFYVVIVSGREDFAADQNKMAGFCMITSDLVLLTQDHKGGYRITTVSGEKGEALSGVTVDLYRYDWQKGHRKVASQLTGPEGLAEFAFDAVKERNSHFLLARIGNQWALDADYLSFYRYQPTQETTASLLYTDRSVYRPMQTLCWKVIGYRGGGLQGKYQTLPQQPLTINLMDANNEKVSEATVTTNEFGSASGSFDIPAGRLLGQWRLDCTLGGSTFLRVEEYKRPTFEVKVEDSKEPLRLNKPALLTGEAKYYFGLPVVNGSVTWQITRQAVYPYWWYWYEWGWSGRGTGSQSQTVAKGLTELKEDGKFEVRFTPEADERLASSEGVTYSYQLQANVTDEGGETRTANRSFRLGFVSVEANVSMEKTFFLQSDEPQLTVSRTDLNGAPRPGTGAWRLVQLVQPKETLLPADVPIQSNPGDKASQAVKTPGDALRTRWDPRYSPEGMIRSWSDGQEKKKGSLEHGQDGSGKVLLPKLDPGAYRLHYETVDDFGAPYKTSKDFLVVGKNRTALALPAFLDVEQYSVPVGETARIFACSGLPDQKMFVEFYRAGVLSERRTLKASQDPQLLEIPISEKDRGGFGVRLVLLRDHQLMTFEKSIFVPWDNKELQVEFATFRDQLRPGQKETWKVTVKQKPGTAGASVEAGAAEILAYMYDRSLDVFAPHHPPSPLSLYPSWTSVSGIRASLGSAQIQNLNCSGLANVPGYPGLYPDRLIVLSGYGIGGMGERGGKGRVMYAMAAVPAPATQAPSKMARRQSNEVMDELSVAGDLKKDKEARSELKAEADKPAEEPQSAETPAATEPLRSNFSETAFWQPHLLTGADGSASIEFSVPDSVTSWNVWVCAVTRDLRGGSIKKETQTVKELMVRPYLPRFLREGDRAELKVVVNNASKGKLTGQVTLDIVDPESNESLLSSFGLKSAGQEGASQPFSVEPGGGANATFSLVAPRRLGPVAFKVTAKAGDLSDGELRPLPVLPSRMHLSQSRFVTLKDKDERVMTFEDLAKNDDPSLETEMMVVTLDAQLFYSVLEALPYLVNYPYECTEQTLNRFLSTGILSSLYQDYPSVGRMAKEFSERKTQYETWDSVDPNRKMGLEETPWLQEAKGGAAQEKDLIKVLDPRIAKAERDSALKKLKKSQTSLGAFPWWPGGPPSPYMTLYILYGFSKALEFGVEVPQDVVVQAWSYMHRHYIDEIVELMMADDCCWETITFLNYALSCYPDDSWTGGVFTLEERKTMLDYSFGHWKDHSPLLKGYLALTLQRADRPQDAKLVFDSVMDSAKTTQDQGTFWAAEDRSWLWYNDTIETHAFALRTLSELEPQDARRHGLVQWLFLNKKLNHWKSTRATAEVIYSLVRYLKQEGALGVKEEATVSVSGQEFTFTFEPDQYTGKKNQIVIPGKDVTPATSSKIVVSKETPGFMFASATWQFATDKLPEEDKGDFFQVSRSYFRRENNGREWVITPLKEGAKIKVGDEIEVHISLRAKHEAEYVHLRDPRPAGLEPDNPVSRCKWDLGICWYEETRDSGTNFFFEQLPVGEYPFKYRLRANMAGTFRVSPATVQSMYAPEFNAYSSGAIMTIEP